MTTTEAKRPYRQTRRAESSDATRQRVLAAARATLERGPLGALKVDEVAREAGVSRSTVYLLYGSRAGLFDALARDLRDQAGFAALIAASQLPDALENLRASQRAAVAMYAQVPKLARGLFTLAAIDPDGVAAVAAIEDGRRPGMRRLAEALAAAGLPARRRLGRGGDRAAHADHELPVVRRAVRRPSACPRTVVAERLADPRRAGDPAPGRLRPGGPPYSAPTTRDSAARSRA